MNREYKTVYKRAEAEEIIKKSRFIGYCKPVDTEMEALEFIEEIRTLNRTATHNCYAYRVVEDGQLRQRYSDDGEPGGTAGLPMVGVLEKEDLINVCVVVTRYYGGIKLGAGGLIRAYTAGCKIGVDAAEIVDVLAYEDLNITLDYELLGVVENFFNNTPCEVYNKIYEDNVKIDVYVRVPSYEDFYKNLNDLTNGRYIMDRGKIVYMPTDTNGRILGGV